MAIDFDLVDLQLFVFIAQAKNLTRGAARAHMSVPDASMRMKNLEGSLNVKLFNREGQWITLQPAGEALLHHACQILQQLEKLDGDLQDYANGIQGHIRLSATTCAIHEFLLTPLGTFLAKYQNVNIDLQDLPDNEIVHGVLNGSIDIGIVSENTPTQDLQTVPFRTSHTVLVVANAHPLAGRDVMHFTESLHHDFVNMQDCNARTADEPPTATNVRIKVDSFEAVCNLVTAGAGIALLPERTARRYRQTMPFKIIELVDDWAHSQKIICVRSLAALPSFGRELIESLDGSVETLEAQDLA